MVPAAQLGLLVENIGVGEIVVIAFLALVVLGPDRIPEMARSAGRLLNNAKKFTSNLSGDMQDVINDPAMQPIRELGEFATRPRQKLAEYALEAEAEERQRLADDAVKSNVPASEGTGSAVDEDQPDAGIDAVAPESAGEPAADSSDPSSTEPPTEPPTEQPAEGAELAADHDPGSETTDPDDPTP